jgi:hypothetical protein
VANDSVFLFASSASLALTTNPLSQFAATTSAQLRGVISDPTGTGAAVFANTPTLVTPVLGAATGTSVNLSGDCKAATFHVGADAGADGTGTTITAITVKKGIVTSITVS